MRIRSRDEMNWGVVFLSLGMAKRRGHKGDACSMFSEHTGARLSQGKVTGPL